MSVCPYCDFENIEGVDVCEQCEQPLDDLHLPDPASLVEFSLLKDRVSLLEPKTPIHVLPDARTGDVLTKLVDRRIGCVLIVENDAVVGIFSERDALLRINDRAEEVAAHPISEFMTPNPQCLQADAKIAFAVRMMDLGGYRHAPVVDAHGKPIGIVSARDILKYLTDRIIASAAS